MRGPRFNTPILPAAAAIALCAPAVSTAAPSVAPEHEIIDEDAVAGDRFGTALAHGTGYLAIGSPLSDSPELSGGKITIERPMWIGTLDDPFAQESASVESIEHLEAAGGAEFGAALGAHGDRLFVGSPGWRVGSSISTKHGAVFVYDVPSGLLATSSMLQMISPGSLHQNDAFGAAVACGPDDYGALCLALGAPARATSTRAAWTHLHDPPTRECAP